MSRREAPIRADLGRPETPEETAERMRETSRKHRHRQTVQNLIAALGVCLLAVLVIVLIVPRDDRPVIRDIDYAEVAAQAQHGYDEPLAAPAMPEGWKANGADIRTSADGVTEWYVGFVIYDADERPEGFVAVSQGLDANDTWVLQKVDHRPRTGSIELAGVQWDEYDHTDLAPDEAGNTRYSLATVIDGSHYVVYGSNEPEQVRALALEIAESRG
ncbi:MAG: DUF4245 domain-containing protein [Microbacteriaceae bacterium]|nr:DUF4245 domain-containing protein [Microbacteriaceae bacterium]